MSPKVLKTLSFFRLVDENGEMSLSNMAIMVVLGKIIMAPTLDLASAALLLPAIGNYAFKHYTKPRAKTPIDDLAETVKKQGFSLDKLKMKAGFPD